jgi:hypothetical protein
MGKGGEFAAAKNDRVKKVNYKLNKLATEELRKWAKAYGLKCKEDEDREILLKVLVSSPRITYALISTDEMVSRTPSQMAFLIEIDQAIFLFLLQLLR